MCRVCVCRRMFQGFRQLFYEVYSSLRLSPLWPFAQLNQSMLTFGPSIQPNHTATAAVRVESSAESRAGSESNCFPHFLLFRHSFALLVMSGGIGNYTGPSADSEEGRISVHGPIKSSFPRSSSSSPPPSLFQRSACSPRDTTSPSRKCRKCSMPCKCAVCAKLVKKLAILGLTTNTGRKYFRIRTPSLPRFSVSPLVQQYALSPSETCATFNGCISLRLSSPSLVF